MVENLERAAEARKLSDLGTSVPDIRKLLRFASFKAVEAAIEADRALDSDVSEALESNRVLELKRLSDAHDHLWDRVVDGDVQASKEVRLIAERRAQLLAVPPAATTAVQTAFAETLAALTVKPEDAALVMLGRRIAEQIDAGASSADPGAATKSLYLVPHLKSVLADLGATPAARGEVGKLAKLAAAQTTRIPTDEHDTGVSGPVVGIAGFQSRRRGRGAQTK